MLYGKKCVTVSRVKERWEEALLDYSKVEDQPHLDFWESRYFAEEPDVKNCIFERWDKYRDHGFDSDGYRDDESELAGT